MIKKILTIFTLMFAVTLLVACADNSITVSFEENGGSNVPDIVLKEPGTIEEFQDPVKEGWYFLGWFTDSELKNEFNFKTKITENMKLYAKWTTEVTVRFNTKTSQTIESLTLGNGGSASKPTDPTRTGYRFGGWFRGKAGLTTYEPKAVEFPLTVNESVTLYAYWEPLDSKAITYTKGETYTSTLQSTTPLILNPLVYSYSHEDEFIDMLVTPMYATEVDWGKAIEKGVADYYGDFSKIKNKEFSIEALDYKYVLVGGAKYPVDSKNDEHLVDGEYNRTGATKVLDTVWTFEIRNDLKFEDGTPITAHTFEYTLKQFLDPDQLNFRSTIFYKDAENKNAYPVKGAAEYFKSGGSWEDVGFEVLSDYKYKVTFFEEVSQASAVAFANDLRLIHKDKYEASLDENGINSKYGTSTHPYVGYGSYIIKSWDANSKLVLNKNYNYVAKETINYKSRVIEIVADLAKDYELYKAGTTDVFGLTNDYYAEFSEDPNLYKSWNGYPQYLIMNVAGSKLEANGHVHPTIMYDTKFRQALFFGFNRGYYSNSVYAPNTATILPIPQDTKGYIQDPLYYSQSPNHLKVLAEHQIDPSTNGYIPERAKSLFNEAYDAWIAEGNTGPVQLKFIASNATTLNTNLANYVKDSLETLFGKDKLEIKITWGSTTATNEAAKYWDFDLHLTNVGFGVSYGAQWQYPAIAFAGTLAGAQNYGLSQPYQYDPAQGKNVYASYFSQVLEVDLTATYEYLLAKKAESEDDPAQWNDDFQYLLDKLMAKDGKEAGIYKDTVEDLSIILIDKKTPWDGTAEAPFTGATQEVWKIVAAFEDVMLEHATLIPTVTRSSATVYKSNVKIVWPEYSGAFAWGSARYRYLTSDSDFADGLYNSFAK